MLSRSDVASSFDDRRLDLILFPTERCNFRCTYCYEDFAAGRMTPVVVNGVKNLITRRAPSLRSLELSWFGGEPMLAQPIIEDISNHAQQLADMNPELHYISSMTTNGYLLNLLTLKRLIRLGVVSYQISLDGPEEVHDRSRIRINGTGSFAVIWSNLLAIRDSGESFNILLRVHVTPDTVDAMPELIENIGNAFAGDERFRVWFKPIGRLGGPNDHNINVFARDEQEKVVVDLSNLLAAAGVKPDVPAGLSYICYAAKPNSLIIRADGALGKCTVALYDDRNRLGCLNEDGTIRIDQSKLRPWLRGFATLDPEDLSCPYRRMPPAPLPRRTLPLTATNPR